MPRASMQTRVAANGISIFSLEVWRGRVKFVSRRIMQLNRSVCFSSFRRRRSKSRREILGKLKQWSQTKGEEGWFASIRKLFTRQFKKRCVNWIVFQNISPCSQNYRQSGDNYCPKSVVFFTRYHQGLTEDIL